MGRRAFRSIACAVSLVCVLAWTGTSLAGQSGATGGEWRTYGADLGNTRYSPLDQINRDNFSKLEIAWRFKTDNLGPQREFEFQSTPLVANGVLYTTAGTRRAAVALDAATGEMKWMYSLDEDKRGAAAPRRLSGRGLSYWTDGKEERIIYVTPGYQLIALDARTGRPIPTFGRSGIVDLKQELDQQIDPITSDIGLHSPPTVAGNTIIVGAAHRSGNRARSKTNVKGVARGYDVRTGRRLWIFHTIPRPGEFGNETWLDDSWSYTGNNGVWGVISVDEELGLAYLPVEIPTGDYYGGHRPGAGLFGSSLVAVDLKTGQRRWHYQFVHHDIWDYDLPTGPVLANVMIDGRMRKIAAQPTKQAFLFVLDRETGAPIWPIEERPVEKGDVPDEWYSPTQPFATKPPPFDRQGFTLDDLIDFTPAIRAEAEKVASRIKLGPLFTPPIVSRWPGPIAAAMVPGAGGGANWPGAALDPETGILYLFSETRLDLRGLVNDPKVSDMNFIGGLATPPRPDTSGSENGRPQGPFSPTVQGLSLVKPPWGRITAIDLKRGEIVWQIAHGETPDDVRNHPALKGVTIPRTGQRGRIGVTATKTLIVSGEGGFTTTSTGQRGAMLRAYDKGTGAEVGAVYMPAPQTGTPMTYMVNGVQYLVVAISGGAYSGELLAFRAPR
jgi:quinoprotein glucose dehydrogenase